MSDRPAITDEMIARIRLTLGPEAFFRWAKAELDAHAQAVLARDPTVRVIVSGEVDERPAHPRFWFVGSPAKREDVSPPADPPTPVEELERDPVSSVPGPRLEVIEGGMPPPGGWTDRERAAAKREQFPDEVDLHPSRNSPWNKRF